MGKTMVMYYKGCLFKGKKEDLVKVVAQGFYDDRQKEIKELEERLISLKAVKSEDDWKLAEDFVDNKIFIAHLRNMFYGIGG